LFVSNELSEKEEIIYRELKQLFPEHNPIIKITRPTAVKLKPSEKRNRIFLTFIDKSLTLFIEEKRCYLKLSQDGGGSYV